MKTVLLKDVVVSDESKQIILNINKELETAEGEYKEFLLTSLERETPGSVIVKCLKDESEKEMTFRIKRNGQIFYHTFFLNENDELTCVVFNERAQVCKDENPQLALAEALCTECIVNGKNQNLQVTFGCPFVVPSSFKINHSSSRTTEKNESRPKQTITEFQAEELTYETGKTYAEIEKEYNIVDVTDHMNHGEEYY